MIDTIAAISVGASIGAWSAVADSVANNRAITESSIIEGAALGAFFAYGGYTVKAVAVGLSIGGAVYSGLSYGPIMFDATATPAQKGAAAVLIFSSLYGMDKGFTYSKVSDGGTVNNCFVAGTLIAEENGKIPINRVKAGDIVWSWDENLGQIELEPVTHVFHRYVRNLMLVRFGTNTVQATLDHPFWVLGEGWIRARDLRIGDALETQSGDMEKVRCAVLESKMAEFYNFEVSQTHTYFVSARAVLVHNACAATLAKNMTDAGITRRSGTAAHHIVARYDPRAAEARAILAREGIDLDDAANGVFLRMKLHRGLHTRAYYRNLTTELNNTPKGLVRAKLIEIGGQLKAKTFPTH